MTLAEATARLVEIAAFLDADDYHGREEDVRAITRVVEHLQSTGEVVLPTTRKVRP